MLLKLSANGNLCKIVINMAPCEIPTPQRAQECPLYLGR